jgi:5-methylcytosine-specific restriction endonuclease McrA
LPASGGEGKRFSGGRSGGAFGAASDGRIDCGFWMVSVPPGLPGMSGLAIPLPAGCGPLGASTNALSMSVLVLNRSFVAVHVTNVRRAISLLFRELAEVVHIEEGHFAAHTLESWRELSAMRAAFRSPDQDWIRAVGYDLQAPRVIRLVACDRGPRRGLRFNRRNVFARDGNLCQYCGRHFPTSELSLDHVVPRSRGGLTSWENIVCACVACNVRKGGRTPDEARMNLVRQPVKPKRSPLLSLKLGNPKYASWKSFVDSAYWTVDLK